MEITHIYSDFSKIGGAQSMVIKLYLGMKLKSVSTRLASYTPYSKIHSSYIDLIKEEEYVVLDKKFVFNIKKETILISHHRKITTTLMVSSKIMIKKLKLIHVAHNEFSNLKWFTIYPKNIIAVSQKVKNNLMNYFKIGEERVKVIHNGIEDTDNRSLINFIKKKNINILYPARITTIKKQIDLVTFIKEKNIQGIHIVFCGDGEEYCKLVKLIANDSRFTARGLVTNMEREYNSSDFVLLFSKREGLPVSLIESCKYGLPIICNDVGGNIEIVEHGINGYIVNDYAELAKLFNNLKNITEEEYINLSKNSRKIFISKFKKELMVKKYFDQINEFYK